MTDETIFCLEHSLKFIGEQVADLSDEEMTCQPKGAPNHPAWTLGHVVLSLQAMAEAAGARPWLPPEWESRFAYGSVPSSTPSGYPSRGSLISALQDAGIRLRRAILAADKKNVSGQFPDEEARSIFPTVGHALVQVVVAHTAYHAGQLASWRRALSKPPVGVFI